eukprot:CAMPEP_0114527776 /NCGR_PEP_ID=MMETSP0109-20121206/23812_1 /TAXON_ID=29199 /ORGANISM="Chlorarachnion reptans, Strain CCCM449" /LENGTH=558 /DNA_ID=CAMNT_0001709795 /DNA_START=254 /DNA_END=1934 /DNA_ORIENTATION=-
MGAYTAGFWFGIGLLAGFGLFLATNSALGASRNLIHPKHGNSLATRAKIFTSDQNQRERTTTELPILAKNFPDTVESLPKIKPQPKIKTEPKTKTQSKIKTQSKANTRRTTTQTEVKSPGSKPRIVRRWNGEGTDKIGSLRIEHGGVPKLEGSLMDQIVKERGLLPLDISRVPVAIVAKDRPDLLRRCLESIERAESSVMNMVTIYQHGHDPRLSSVAEDFQKQGVSLVRNEANTNNGEAHVRIARHYKFVLSRAFENPETSYVIVLEDDMEVSVDFFLYFQSIGRLYEVDDSIYCISTWNDNGFLNKVRDSRRVLRSEFFMGLGWLVSRKLYKEEWEPRWPSAHWDHWLRDPRNRKGRECVYPEISRNYNSGSVGVHVNHKFYNKFLKRIKKNGDKSSPLRLQDAIKGERRTYEQEQDLLLRSAIVNVSFPDISSNHKNGVFALAFEKSRRGSYIWESDPNSAWAKIAQDFGIWHEFRTFRQGLVQFWHEDNFLILVEKGSKAYQRLAELHSEPVKQIYPGESRAPKMPPEMLVVAAQAQSCDDAASNLRNAAARDI